MGLNYFHELLQVNKAQQLLEMESSHSISLEERQGTTQRAESGGSLGNRDGA